MKTWTTVGWKAGRQGAERQKDLLEDMKTGGRKSGKPGQNGAGRQENRGSEVTKTWQTRRKGAGRKKDRGLEARKKRGWKTGRQGARRQKNLEERKTRAGAGTLEKLDNRGWKTGRFLGHHRLQGGRSIKYLPSLQIQFHCTVCTASCRCKQTVSGL